MDIFEIILGSYESFVIGIKFRYKSQVCRQHHNTRVGVRQFTNYFLLFT